MTALTGGEQIEDGRAGAASAIGGSIMPGFLVMAPARMRRETKGGDHPRCR
jgi:hypothetical protein